jgi:cbb3-type cytochrome oxidase maturation protein
MSVLLIAVPAALAFAISAVIAFLWASRTGQLDDLDTPPLRMLHDESSRAESEREPEPAGAGAERNARGTPGRPLEARQG